MPTFKVTGGALSGVLMSGDAGIDNTLPEGPGGPVDPGWGNRPPSGGTLPEQPPGVWPPINWHTPIQPLPPEASVPPGTIWPPVHRPVDPGYDRPDLAPVRPGQPLPPAPARPGHDLPTPPAGTLPVKRLFWMLAYCPALGWNFVCVDPSLSIGGGPAPTPEPK